MAPRFGPVGLGGRYMWIEADEDVVTTRIHTPLK